MASADDLPEELLALSAQMEREALFRDRLQLHRLTKLDAPLKIEAGECGTSLGVTLHGPGNDDIALTVLALNAMENPGCQGDPIGYTERTEGGRRHLDIYWPAVA